MCRVIGRDGVNTYFGIDAVLSHVIHQLVTNGNGNVLVAECIVVVGIDALSNPSTGRSELHGDRSVDTLDRCHVVVELREASVIDHVPVAVLRHRNERVRWNELVIRHVLGDGRRCPVDAELQTLNVAAQDHVCSERREVVTLCDVKRNIGHDSVLTVGARGL
ncbi:hypothetical protein D3C86_1145950 [compost metagenome]